MEKQEAEERIKRLLDDGCSYYGAWQRGILVGVFCLSEGEESVYVFDFAVDGDYQGRGIGKALLKELIRIVQESRPCVPEKAEEYGEESATGISMKKIRIQVGSRNGSAFRLYQKNGFQVISQRDYYRISPETGE